MKKTLLTIGIYTAFFLVLSEKISIINILVSIIVGFLVYKLNSNSGELAKLFNLRTVTTWTIFVLMLFLEIVKANFQVAKIALSVDMKLEPQIVVYESRIRNNWLITILANVITLTPGTMSVDISDNRLKIHCLNKEYAEGLDAMVLEKLLFKIEGGYNG